MPSSSSNSSSSSSSSTGDSTEGITDNTLQYLNFPQDAPDSPKDDGVPPGSLVAAPMASVTPMEGVEPGGPGEMRSRHLLYTTHFPLPHVWNRSLSNMILQWNFLYYSLIRYFPLCSMQFQ
jgi:hypothetical protein